MNKNWEVWAFLGILTTIFGIICNIFAYVMVLKNSYLSAFFAFLGFIPSSAFAFVCILDTWKRVLTKKKYEEWSTPFKFRLTVAIFLTVSFLACSVIALHQFNSIKNQFLHAKLEA